MLQTLATELIHSIVEHVPLADLLSLSQTARVLRKAVHINIARNYVCDRWFASGTSILRYYRHITNMQSANVFATLAKDIRSVCKGCKNTLRTYEHPVYRGTLVCEICMAGEDYAVVRFSKAMDEYSFPRDELILFAEGRKHFVDVSCNDHATSRKRDIWILLRDVHDLAVELYGTPFPLSVQRARKLNRIAGVKKRAINYGLKRSVLRKLMDIGYHRKEVGRLRELDCWNNTPRCFGDVSTGVPKTTVSIEEFVSECIKVLTTLRENFFLFNKFEADMLACLHRRKFDPEFIDRFATSEKIVAMNQYAFFYGAIGRLETYPLTLTHRYIDDLIEAHLYANGVPNNSMHLRPLDRDSYFKKPLDWQRLGH